MTNSIDVPSVDDFSKKISTGGGKVMQPKMVIPGIGYLAICEDTEGNSFGIIQGRSLFCTRYLKNESLRDEKY